MYGTHFIVDGCHVRGSLNFDNEGQPCHSQLLRSVWGDRFVMFAIEVEEYISKVLREFCSVLVEFDWPDSLLRPVKPWNTFERVCMYSTIAQFDSKDLTSAMGESENLSGETKHREVTEIRVKSPSVSAIPKQLEDIGSVKLMPSQL